MTFLKSMFGVYEIDSKNQMFYLSLAEIAGNLVLTTGLKT